MTVMVTGASGMVGHALLPPLVARDEVRACIRRPEDAEALRDLGAKVAVGRLDDEDALSEVLQRVHTVFHLVGGPDQPDEDEVFAANHRSTLTALAASGEAGVRRFVLISVPGADPDSSDPFLRAKGLAEEAVVNSGLQHAVIRSTHAYGLGGLWFTAVVQGALASPPLTLGDDALAPVSVEDLAAAVVAADDRPGELAGTWALEGPDVVTPAALTKMLAGSPQRPVPLGREDAGTRLSALLERPVPPLAADHLLRAERADAPDAAEAFDVTLTPLAEGLRRLLERAAVIGAR